MDSHTLQTTVKPNKPCEVGWFADHVSPEELVSFEEITDKLIADSSGNTILCNYYPCILLSRVINKWNSNAEAGGGGHCWARWVLMIYTVNAE